jgi:diguanylate cyclase (GGDEF)-like protein
MMAAGVVLAGVGVLLVAGLLLALRAAEVRRRQAQQHLQQVAALVATIAGGDWLRSLHAMVSTLVEGSTCTAAVILVHADNGALEQRAAAYGPAMELWTEAEDTAARKVVETGQQAVSDKGWLLFPVTPERETVGVLAVLGARADSPVLRTAVRLVALGLGSMQAYQKQAVLSTTDGLTGLANHRHFQQTLSVALAQAYLEGEPLSVILLDIDHFKAVNDTYGHLLGDLVLRELAYLLRQQLPPQAMAARYGGEEFVVVLQATPVERAQEVAETIRRAVMEHRIFDMTSGTKLSVTVSLGVAGYELGQGKGRLMARADEALYQSKHGGRNRVTAALPENSTSHLFPS